MVRSASSFIAPPDASALARISLAGLSHIEIRQSSFKRDIWVYDLERGTRARLTTDAGPDSDPIWNPDGERIVFSWGPDGTDDLFSRSADGSGEPELLLASDIFKDPHSFSPDGKRLPGTPPPEIRSVPWSCARSLDTRRTSRPWRKTKTS